MTQDPSVSREDLTESPRRGPTPEATTALGAGVLSAAAEARLARRPPEEPPMPDWDDAAAVAGWRAAQNTAWGEEDLATGPPHRREVIAGVPCRVAGPSAAPLVVYLHGGGYGLGSSGTAMPITATLARRLQVVSVDYRLAPEHPFPAALDDVLAVVECVGESAPIWLAGDSAGGGIATSTAIELVTTSARRRVEGLVLLAPHLDQVDAGRKATGIDTAVKAMSDGYRGSLAPTDPRVSPARASSSDLARLPPTLIQTGTADHLHSHALAFARQLRSAGADVSLDVWIGLWHAWHYHPELPEATRALTEAAQFVIDRAS